MRLRFPFVLFAALAAFVITAGSAFASPPTITAPAPGTTISQGQTFTVDASGVSGAGGVNFYIDSGSGDYTLGGQFVGGSSMGQVTDNGAGVYTWANTGFTFNDGPLTLDAVVVNGSNVTLATASVSLIVDNSVSPLTISSIAPADGSTVSGTFTLRVTPSDPNNTVTSGDYSIQGGATGTLVSDGNGNFAASINSGSLSNGDIYIDTNLVDGAGNQASSSASLHLVVQNLHAPTITPNTLIANKSQFRTDETQLETGDIVQAYGMQADGYPAPTISYVWHVCPAGGGACTDVPADVHGNYTVQPGTVGATLTLIATATNSQGSASTTVAFGAIAQGYVAPTVTPGTFTVADANGHSTVQIGDLLQVTHAPAYTGGYPAPTTTYTWVICHDMNCQTANGPTYTVQAGDAGAAITVYADVMNSRGADSAWRDLGTVASPPAPVSVEVIAPPAAAPVVIPPVIIPPVVVPPLVTVPRVTPAEKKAIDVALKAVTVEKAAAVKAKAEAAVAQKQVVVEQKKADTAVSKVAAPTATEPQKTHVFVAVSKLVAKQADDALKVNAAKSAAAQAALRKAEADKAVADAAKQLLAKKAASVADVDAAKKKLAASEKTAAGVSAVAAAATAKVTTTTSAAKADVTAAKAEVHAAVVTVSAGKATPTQETQVVAAVKTLVVTKDQAAEKAKDAKDASKKLAVAKTKLATVTAAAHKP